MLFFMLKLTSWFLFMILFYRHQPLTKSLLSKLAAMRLCRLCTAPHRFIYFHRNLLHIFPHSIQHLFL